MTSPAESPVTGASAQAPPSFEALLDDLARRLNRHLEAWFVERHRDFSAMAGEASRELTDRLEELVLRGGKRLRPALIYYAYRATGGRDEAQVLPSAMAAEILHAYLLVHDDIMDRAETRRGGPAAHLAFRDHHLAVGWLGSADQHGEAAAILLGDLAHSYAVELFFSTSPQPAGWPGVVAAFHEMCQEVVVGQYLEMTASFRSELSEAELLQILRMKSGRYSVERPIQIGAGLAAADPTALAGLAVYGRHLGEAFQLKDDLLGVFGERDAVGKPVGGDLKEGKHTVLIHHTLAAATAEDRRLVEAVLGNQSASPDEVAEACRVIEAVGARARVEEMVDQRMAAAREVLAGLELTSEGGEFFSGLLRFLKERES